MQVAGYLKTSLIDYPNKLASVIYTNGCDFNCGFCHNKDLVLSTTQLVKTEYVLNHLEQRKNILDGVVITGGEPTLQKSLIPFLALLKSKGLLIKLDTNGHQPHVLEAIFEQGLVDYVAMDIKNSIEKYADTVSSKLTLNSIERSVQLIQNSGLDYEFRTTWIKQFHQESDLNGIGKLIKGSKRYVFQQYHPSEKQLKPTKYDYFTLEEMTRLKDEIKVQYKIDDVVIRGKY